MNPSNCFQFSYWNHSLSFSKHTNFAVSAFWNHTCDMKITPVKWRSQRRLEIAAAFWKCTYGLNFAGAIFVSQVRNWQQLWSPAGFDICCSNVMENVKAYHNTKLNDNKNPAIWIKIYLSRNWLLKQIQLLKHIIGDGINKLVIYLSYTTKTTYISFKHDT